MFHIQPRVEGVTEELRRLYQYIDASTLGHLTDFGYLRGIRPLYRPTRLLGNAVTVRIPHLDGSAIGKALAICQAGDVLVIDMSGDHDRACWGELRTLAALRRQLAGVVISGGVTDTRAVTALGFPVFSRAVSALTTRMLELEGEVNTPVSIGGVSVQPGDLVVADDDGVFILNPEMAFGLGPRALEKQAKEALRRKEISPN